MEPYVPSPEERTRISHRRHVYKEEVQRQQVLEGLGEELSNEFTKQYEEWAEDEADLMEQIHFCESQIKEANKLLKHHLLKLQKEGHRALLRRFIHCWWQHAREHNV